MIVTKRTQGRPPRNSGVNGREKLIEATRNYLQSNRKMSLTRTEIAQGCGVTPALISYYFKDKKSLLDAVTKPLLRSYRARLAAIFSLPVSSAEKMHHVIRLLIQLNADDAFLVDHMLRQTSHDELDDEDRAAVNAFQSAIAALVHELVQNGGWQASDTRLTDIAVWGLCRAFGEALRADTGTEPDQTGTSEVLDARVSFIYALFAPRGDNTPAEAAAVA